MDKEILRARLTCNVRQLKKYIDEAIEKGAETIRFDLNKDNPYFIFFADFTPEQENEYEIKKLKLEYQEKLTTLERIKFKTHTFRIKQWGLCGQEIDDLIENFKKHKNIEKTPSIGHCTLQEGYY